MNKHAPIVINHFSDILCVWAYIAQIRIDELQKEFTSSIQVEYHFTPIFGDIETRIEKGWATKGGYEGYAKHVHDTVKQFPHITLHPEVWRTQVPNSSANTHLFLKAAQIVLEGENTNTPAGQRSPFEELTWRMRHAFFHEGLNIGQLENQLHVADSLNLPTALIQENIHNGRAMAALCRDNALCQEHNITGSPTYLFNNGRQRLYGNIGYKIIAANIHELLNAPEHQASWC